MPGGSLFWRPRGGLSSARLTRACDVFGIFFRCLAVCTFWLAMGTVGLLPATATASGLFWTIPQSSWATDICYGNDRFVAVGLYGTIHWSTDGLTWYAAESPYTGSYAALNGVCYDGGFFIAVGTGGTILRSADGKTWISCLSPTTKTLSSVWGAEGRFVAVGEQATILVSTDGDRWSIVGYSDPLERTYPLGDLSAVMAGNGIWVAAEASQPTGLWSPDGVTWTRIYTGAGSVEDIIFDGTRFVGVSSAGSQSKVLTSADGVNWQTRQTPGQFTGICHARGRYVVAAIPGQLFASTDLENWTMVAATSGPKRIAFGDGKFASIGIGSRATSIDGISWEVRSLAPEWDSIKTASCSFRSKRYVVGYNGYISVYDHSSETLTPLESGGISNFTDTASNGSSIVAVGEEGVILWSGDGEDWNRVDSKTTGTLRRIIPARGGYCAVGEGGALITSEDGIIWRRAVSGVNRDIMAVVDNGSLAVASILGGGILLSADLVTWERVAGPPQTLSHMVFGNGIYVATDSFGTAWRSVNGTEWEDHSSGSGGWVAGIAFGAGRFVLINSLGFVRTSTDGKLWRGEPTGIEWADYINDIAFGDGRFFAVGHGQMLLSSRVQPIDLFRPALRAMGDSRFGYFIETPEDGYVFDIERSSDLRAWETVARDRTAVGSSLLYTGEIRSGETQVFFRAKLSNAH